MLIYEHKYEVIMVFIKAPVANLSDYLINALKERGQLFNYSDLQGSQANFIKENCQIMICSGNSKVDKTVIDSIPKLKLIVSYAVGYDGIDINYCKTKGIHFCNTPDVLNDDVADCCLSLVLNLVREFYKGKDYILKDKWLQAQPPLTKSLKGLKVGILGMGRIGRAIASRLSVCKCEISYCARSKKDDLTYTYYQDVKSLAQNCECLILALNASSETKYMINLDILKFLGSNSYLINIARGSIVNTSDLKYALTHNIIKAAAIDVFENEPNVDKELVAMDNVVAYPHVGSATVQTRKQMANLCILNIDLFIKGQELKSKVV